MVQRFRIQIAFVTLVAFFVAAMPLFAAETTNSHSADLEGSSSQYWSITDAGQTGLDVSADASFGVWVKLESSPPSGEWDTWFSKWGAGATAAYFLGYRNNAGTFQIYWNSTADCSNSDGTVSINQTLTEGTWYHIMYVKTGTSLEIFVDNTSIGTGTVGATICDSTAPFLFGAFDNTGSPTWFSDGLIDGVTVFNDDLTSGERSTLYSDPCNPPTTDLVSWWQFNNDGNDSDGSNNLTNNNSITFSSTDKAYTCVAAATGADDTSFEILN